VISKTDFIGTFFTDPDGNDLMLHNRYAGYE